MNEKETAIDEFVAKLRDQEFATIQNLVDCPFFFYKRRWELTAQVKQIQSLLKFALFLQKSYTT